MEIVPLIYTTLIIVIALAIFVTAGSYISYKTKLKKDVLGKKNPAGSPPPFKIDKQLKATVQRFTKPLFHPGEPRLKEKIISPSNIPNPPAVNYRPDKKDGKKSKHKENPNNPNSRLAILNSPEPKEKNIAEKIPPTVNANNPDLKSLDDNLLDKYTDESNQATFTLNVKDIKKKK